ncbi:MAG: pantetheine-phosphate adenylyltransferase [Thermoplasmatota archaeon]
MKVCIGGTFDLLHKGHKKLIDKAFEVAGKNGFVFIGLTTKKITKRKKTVETIEEREKELKKYLTEKNFINRAFIKPISDKYGPSVEEDFDAIIVSPETYETAEKINIKRIKKKKKPLKIIKIPFVLADDGKTISSTRILKGEIDKNGHIIKDD